MGRREIKKSLGTSDPREAKRIAITVCAEIEATLENARRSLTMGAAEIEALKGEYLRERLDVIVKEAQKSQWAPRDFHIAYYPLLDRLDEKLPANLDESEYEEARSAAAAAWGEEAVAAILKRHNLNPSPRIKSRLGEEVFKAELEAHRAARAKVYGDIDWLPPSYASASIDDTATVLELFNEYAKSAELAPRTVDGWRTYITRANGYLKSKSAVRVTKQDVRSFAEALRQGDKTANPNGKPLSVKSINDNYLAALSAVYKWAIDRERLKVDPTKGVRLKERAREKLPVIAYKREEVATILAATRVIPETRVKPETANVRRWIPWLCAFTGARVSELLWLKRNDVEETQGIHYINIRPDVAAGRSIKNASSIRSLPLHPAIIAEGFLDYWKALPLTEEYLFPGNWSDKDGDRAKPPANRLRDWLKAQLPHANWERLSPNHSFRHWLTSELRIAKVDGDYARAIIGHRHKDEHGNYGPGQVPTLYNELKLVPSPLDPE